MSNKLSLSDELKQAALFESNESRRKVLEEASAQVAELVEAVRVLHSAVCAADNNGELSDLVDGLMIERVGVALSAAGMRPSVSAMQREQERRRRLSPAALAAVSAQP